MREPCTIPLHCLQIYLLHMLVHALIDRGMTNGAWTSRIRIPNQQTSMRDIAQVFYENMFKSSMNRKLNLFHSCNFVSARVDIYPGPRAKVLIPGSKSLHYTSCSEEGVPICASNTLSQASTIVSACRTLLIMKVTNNQQADKNFCGFCRQLLTKGLFSNSAKMQSKDGVYMTKVSNSAC